MPKPQRKVVATKLEKAPEAAAPPKRRRLSGDERRAAILAEAAALFAETGFSASTRALAARLGITQAALYKHFRSKDEIVAALMEKRAARWRNEDWHEALASNDAALGERLGQLYGRYVNAVTRQSMRLFVRAGLDGYGQPGRRGAMLTAAILEPVVAALHQEAGLPDLSSRPMRHEEREIAMALHGAVMAPIRAASPAIPAHRATITSTHSTCSNSVQKRLGRAERPALSQRWLTAPAEQCRRAYTC